ncbi:glutathione S-transferase family protein [Oceanomicrobium pacificus]|uniref:Glutathione S-transferase family protein n=1 Tax=Oceanomicrobium pacificus TaxID=2692916 RepID=A0A6B0TV65_9RHOB|nr:glutathione S-transferase family protein [Oceanomicrobium pacificus]MXU65102.1 hypothetical protein [Oceanomicrobium pacificus]
MKLYHGSTSVCSAKVRLGLAERGLDWDGQILDLGKGEQSSDWYLALNPNGVVPTLVDGDLTVVESSVILEHLDSVGAATTLMPDNPAARTRARMWLAACIDIHAAINTMTFATSKRDELLASRTPEQLSASIARMAHPANAAKRRDILDNGLQSTHVTTAFFTLRDMFDRMDRALSECDWLLGQEYSIADTAILAYVDRLDRLGLAVMFEARTPSIAGWLDRSRERPSYRTAVEAYAGPAEHDRALPAAAANRAMIEPLWSEFVGRPTGQGQCRDAN